MLKYIHLKCTNTKWTLSKKRLAELYGVASYEWMPKQGAPPHGDAAAEQVNESPGNNPTDRKRELRGLHGHPFSVVTATNVWSSVLVSETVKFW